MNTRQRKHDALDRAKGYGALLQAQLHGLSHTDLPTDSGDTFELLNGDAPINELPEYAPVPGTFRDGSHGHD
jgi:hypothetical protein